MILNIFQDRARIAVKRRPSTKRGREAVRKSCVEITLEKTSEVEEDSNDVSVDKPPMSNRNALKAPPATALISELSKRQVMQSVLTDDSVITIAKVSIDRSNAFATSTGLNYNTKLNKEMYSDNMNAFNLLSEASSVAAQSDDNTTMGAGPKTIFQQDEVSKIWKSLANDGTKENKTIKDLLVKSENVDGASSDSDSSIHKTVPELSGAIVDIRDNTEEVQRITGGVKKKFSTNDVPRGIGRDAQMAQNESSSTTSSSDEDNSKEEPAILKHKKSALENYKPKPLRISIRKNNDRASRSSSESSDSSEHVASGCKLNITRTPPSKLMFSSSDSSDSSLAESLQKSVVVKSTNITTRRTSVVSTDNFESTDYKLVNFDDEEDEDDKIFNTKELPKSKIFKSLTFEEDDDDVDIFSGPRGGRARDSMFSKLNLDFSILCVTVTTTDMIGQ